MANRGLFLLPPAVAAREISEIQGRRTKKREKKESADRGTMRALKWTLACANAHYSRTYRIARRHSINQKTQGDVRACAASHPRGRRASPISCFGMETLACPCAQRGWIWTATLRHPKQLAIRTLNRTRSTCHESLATRFLLRRIGIPAAVRRDGIRRPQWQLVPRDLQLGELAVLIQKPTTFPRLDWVDAWTTRAIYLPAARHLHPALVL